VIGLYSDSARDAGREDVVDIEDFAKGVYDGPDVGIFEVKYYVLEAARAVRVPLQKEEA
jgi:hypothetical protein